MKIDTSSHARRQNLFPYRGCGLGQQNRVPAAGSDRLKEVWREVVQHCEPSEGLGWVLMEPERMVEERPANAYR
ncbi:MAG TPA: hypothetical protein PKJ41_21440 [Bryobacteraceae bacterium]|nr:hypothetical protein [Bryobacteraceae bacterium]